jgi:dTDP-4-amino-4,6-dideoxygalactose transaminase
LFAQFERRDQIQATRRLIWEYYDYHLADWAAENGIRRPFIPAYCNHPYHMYYLLLPSFRQRQALIAHLKQRGITSVFHYQPLHLSEMGRKAGGKQGDCPVTEDVSDRLVRLPFYNELPESDQSRIVSALFEFRGAGAMHAHA